MSMTDNILATTVGSQIAVCQFRPKLTAVEGRIRGCVDMALVLESTFSCASTLCSPRSGSNVKSSLG